MEKTRIYYDGLCKVCSAEINHYRKQVGAEELEFIDITQPNFDAAREGLDPYKVHLHLHARKPDGQILTGVDTFIEIWNLLPRYQWAARLAQKLLIKKALEFGYRFFVKLRPYLPRYKENCAHSPYCEHTN